MKPRLEGNISHDELLELIHYDPIAGEWNWTGRRTKGIIKGAKPGNISKTGRLRIFVNGKFYLSSRLAFFYMTGRWSEYDIDHIDGNKLNDRFSNLREATRSQNLANKKCMRKGLKGVTLHKRRTKDVWSACVQVNKKSIRLGFFGTEQEAHEAYCQAAKKYHGEFARFE